MEKTLHFIALYNSQIIQVGFGIVLLLIVVYVYRIFFMANVTEGAGESNNIEILEEKLNIIIEQQKQRPAVAGAPQATERTQDQGATPEEVDQLKAEIYNLRQQITETEKNSSSSSSKNAGSSSGATVKVESVQESGKAVQLEAQISDLKSRLSEYEIIADDIAELSQLRTDNAKLIHELAAVKASLPAELPAVIKTEVKEIAQDVQPPIEDLTGIDTSISTQDQISIDDFEKNTQKKENE